MISRRQLFGLLAALATSVSAWPKYLARPFLGRRFYPGRFNDRCAWEDLPNGVHKFDGLTDNRTPHAKVDDGITDPDWFASRAAEVRAAQLDHDLLVEELAKLDARPIDAVARARAQSRVAEIRAMYERQSREWRARHPERSA